MYDNSKKIDQKKIEELKDILSLSPSSINSQPWKFTFVKDDVIKAKLAEASFFNADRINNCDTLVVFNRINSVDLFEKQINEMLSQGQVDYYKKFLKDLPEQEIMSWFEKQVYLALGVFLSACANMNIDSTPMEGIEASKYDEILGNENYSSIVSVAIGYRDDEDFNQISLAPKKRKNRDIVIEEI